MNTNPLDDTLNFIREEAADVGHSTKNIEKLSNDLKLVCDSAKELSDHLDNLSKKQWEDTQNFLKVYMSQDALSGQTNDLNNIDKISDDQKADKGAQTYQSRFRDTQLSMLGHLDWTDRHEIREKFPQWAGPPHSPQPPYDSAMINSVASRLAHRAEEVSFHKRAQRIERQNLLKMDVESQLQLDANPDKRQAFKDEIFRQVDIDSSSCDDEDTPLSVPSKSFENQKKRQIARKKKRNLEIEDRDNHTVSLYIPEENNFNSIRMMNAIISQNSPILPRPNSWKIMKGGSLDTSSKGQFLKQPIQKNMNAPISPNNIENFPIFSQATTQNTNPMTPRTKKQYQSPPTPSTLKSPAASVPQTPSTLPPIPAPQTPTIKPAKILPKNQSLYKAPVLCPSLAITAEISGVVDTGTINSVSPKRRDMLKREHETNMWEKAWSYLNTEDSTKLSTQEYQHIALMVQKITKN